jgi:hypothetical protein
MAGDENRGEGSSSAREVLMAIILGLGTVGASYASYQSGQCSGDSQNYYTASQISLSAALTGSVNAMELFTTEAVGLMIADSHRMMAEEGVSPAQNRKVADRLEQKYLDKRLVKGTRGAKRFDEVDTDAYETEAIEEADQLTKQGEKQITKAKYFNEKGDRFQMVSLFYTLVLFFGGLAPVFKRPAIQSAMTSISILLLAAATVRLWILVVEKVP